MIGLTLQILDLLIKHFNICIQLHLGALEFLLGLFELLALIEDALNGFALMASSFFTLIDVHKINVSNTLMSVS